jgi:inulin fructotransferase (DFA-I-forming)
MPTPANTVYDVTTFSSPSSTDPHNDIGKVINEIIALIKSLQTSPTTRPGAVIYIPPGQYDLLTTAEIDISYLQIKGSGHGFQSTATWYDNGQPNWIEQRPGASCVRVINAGDVGFHVYRAGAGVNNSVGRLNSIEFRDFCITGVSNPWPTPFSPGNGKTGIFVENETDSLRIEGMGMLYLEYGISTTATDAANITNNFLTEVGSCLNMFGNNYLPKITNNVFIATWTKPAVFVEGGEGALITGNEFFWHGALTLKNMHQSNISGNRFVSQWPGMLFLDHDCNENLISGNQFTFRRQGALDANSSNGRDDLFGIVQLNGYGNSVTANLFVYSSNQSYVLPNSSTTPTIILVKSGNRNYIATNHMQHNIPVRIVLDASTTNTKILWTMESASEVQALGGATYQHVPVP